MRRAKAHPRIRKVTPEASTDPLPILREHHVHADDVGIDRVDPWRYHRIRPAASRASQARINPFAASHQMNLASCGPAGRADRSDVRMGDVNVLPNLHRVDPKIESTRPALGLLGDTSLGSPVSVDGRRDEPDVRPRHRPERGSALP